MAKVSGPLMSMAASGSVGNAITFSIWKGRAYVRNKVTPSNPQSPAQTGVRANMAGLTSLWKANTNALQSAFAEMGKQNSYSAFNAFTSYNQKRQSKGLAAANSTNPQETPPSANSTDMAAVANGKFVTLTWDDSVDTTAWTNQIYMLLGTAPTGTRSELKGLIRRGVQTLEIGPLESGTWNIGAVAVTEEGGTIEIGNSTTVVVA